MHKHLGISSATAWRHERCSMKGCRACQKEHSVSGRPRWVLAEADCCFLAPRAFVLFAG